MMIANGCARPAQNGRADVSVAPAAAEADPPVLADHGPARKGARDAEDDQRGPQSRKCSADSAPMSPLAIKSDKL